MIIIDGKLKSMLDIIIEKEDAYNQYTELIKDLMFSGIQQYIQKYNKPE
ncbi:hypothetical protein ABEO94_03780 [Bacillus pumilus]